jgi:hypothetical protein
MLILGMNRLITKVVVEDLDMVVREWFMMQRLVGWCLMHMNKR